MIHIIYIIIHLQIYPKDIHLGLINNRIDVVVTLKYVLEPKAFPIVPYNQSSVLSLQITRTIFYKVQTKKNK